MIDLILPSGLMLIGIVFILKGADFLVDGASSLAKRFAIPEIVIGLTVVAFGTSAPELIVNIFASIGKHNEITLGNIIGSNIFNILLILGVSSLIYPLTVKKKTTRVEMPFSLLATLILMWLLNDYYYKGKFFQYLSRFDGIILLILFTAFFVYVFLILKTPAEGMDDIIVYPGWQTILYLIFGLIGLFVGGRVIVDNGVILARELHISEKVIGLTVISLGTSLPELATSAVAAYKRRFDISVGNIVGSNIFNIFLVLGVSSLIYPIQYNIQLNMDLTVLIAANILLIAAMFIGKKKVLGRLEGMIFLIMFIGYMVYVILRK